jgi:AcrR family transcriptional regulator
VKPGCDPRVARSRAAVLEATLDLLAEEGAEGCTIEAIATRSGVAKTTIYRHWPSRAALVIDAVRTLMESPPEVPDTGRARADVTAILQGLAERLRTGQLADVAPALVAAVDADPTLGELMEVYVQCRRDPLRTVLRRAVKRGELRADLDVELAIDLCAGPLFYRRLVARRPAEPVDVEALVDLVFTGLGAEAAAGGRGRGRQAM